MRVLLVANPASRGGRGADSAATCARHLRAAGARVEVVVTRRAGEARRLLARLPPDVDRVAACGGDGFLQECVAALAGGEVPLAVLPGGRGNDLARALEMPEALPAAARVAASGCVERVDLGDADGRTFHTVVTCGLDAEVSRLARGMSWAPGRRLPYLIALTRALPRHAARHVRLSTEGRALFEGRAWLVAIANTPTYGGGIRIAPHASIRDGRLDACVVVDLPMTRAPALLVSALSGAHETRREVRVFRAASFDLEATPPEALEADGEPLTSTPTRVSALGAVLPVVRPVG